MTPSFKAYLQECVDGEGSTLPATIGTPHALNLHDEGIRDDLNFALMNITDTPERVHPIILFERVRDRLDAAGYSLPSATEKLDLFTESDGDEVFVLSPPHLTDEEVPADCYLYFAFAEDDQGAWDVLAEIVNSIELEDILSE